MLLAASPQKRDKCRNANLNILGPIIWGNLSKSISIQALSFPLAGAIGGDGLYARKKNVLPTLCTAQVPFVDNLCMAAADIWAKRAPLAVLIRRAGQPRRRRGVTSVDGSGTVIHTRPARPPETLSKCAAPALWRCREVLDLAMVAERSGVTGRVYTCPIFPISARRTCRFQPVQHRQDADATTSDGQDARAASHAHELFRIRILSFPREREWTRPVGFLDPRFRGGDKND
jgi:hypothetical protein